MRMQTSLLPWDEKRQFLSKEFYIFHERKILFDLQVGGRYMGNRPANEGELSSEERQELDRLRQLAQRRRGVMNQVMTSIEGIYNEARKGEINFSAIRDLLGLMIENPSKLNRFYSWIKTYCESSQKPIVIVICFICVMILGLFLKIFWEEITHNVMRWVAAFAFEWIPNFFELIGTLVKSIVGSIKGFCLDAYNSLRRARNHPQGL